MPFKVGASKMDEVNAEFDPAWKCPNCDALGDDGDDGLTHNGYSIHVICYDCDHEYTVNL